MKKFVFIILSIYIILSGCDSSQFSTTNSQINKTGTKSMSYQNIKFDVPYPVNATLDENSYMNLEYPDSSVISITFYSELSNSKLEKYTNDLKSFMADSYSEIFDKAEFYDKLKPLFLEMSFMKLMGK